MNPKVSIRSAAIVIALAAIFTIGSELSASIKGFFTLFGHHWIGKSVVLLAVFCLLQLVFAKSERAFSVKDTWWLVGTVVVGGLAIALFYTWHFN